MATDTLTFRFDTFELDPVTRRLVDGGRRISLQDRPFDLLLYLVRHRDRIVTREELLREVWPGVTVGPQALGFALHAVRRALDDDGTRQRLIRTVARAGIQFVGPVSVSPSSPVKETDGPRVHTAPFLSRGSLASEAEKAMDCAARGMGRALLLSGEPGIGKTRALSHIAAIGLERGFRVLEGHCLDGSWTPAYWPWAQIIRHSIGDVSPQRFLRTLGEGSREVSWMVPELRELAAFRAEPSGDPRAVRLLLFDGIVTIIREIAHRLPVLLSIDDLQNADPDSVVLLEYLVRELQGDRVFIVAAYRDAEMRVVPAIAAAVARIASFATSRYLKLDGLSTNGVRDFVNAVSGRLTTSAVVVDLHAKTNGNPFFLSQLVRVLEAEERLDQLEGKEALEVELPRHVQDAIRRQLQLVPIDTREILGIASVIGRQFSIADLEGALGLSRASVSLRLEPALDLGILTVDRRALRRYSFVHELVRDAIYTSIHTWQRVKHHALIAASIEREQQDSNGARSSELAHHFLRAQELIGVDRAVYYSELAAEWATKHGGFEDAAGHLSRAKALLSALTQRDSEHECGLLIKLGDARNRIGDREGARNVFIEAVEIAHQAGLSELLATAALRYGPDFLAIETGVYDSEQVEILEKALAAIGESDLEVRSRLLGRLSVALHWSDEAANRRGELVAESLRLANKSNDRAAVVYADTAARLASFSVDNTKGLLEVLGEPTNENDPCVLLVGRLIRITALWLEGDLGAVRGEIEEFGDAARRLRQPQADWYEILLRSTLALMEGRFNDASSLATAYLERGRLAGDRNATHSFLLQSFMSSIDRGGIDRFERGIYQMVEDFPRVIGWRSGLLLFLTETGRWEEAEELLEQLAAAGALEKPKRNEWYALIGAMAIAAARIGNKRRAAEIYDALVPHESQLAVIGYGSYCWGSTQQLLGLCAMTAGNEEQAVVHLKRALEVNKSVGATPAMARTHRDLAWVAQRVGNSTEAGHHIAECLRICSRLGMNRLADNAALCCD